MQRVSADDRSCAYQRGERVNTRSQQLAGTHLRWQFVLKMDASNLPVCLVTLRGEDLSETQLKDLAQNVLRNQLAGVAGAAVPLPFGGRWREIMLYADPFKLEARQMSLMDVVRAMNESNLIL